MKENELKKYTSIYSSNTLAASGNQFIFHPEKGEIITSRVFYKIFKGGKYNYSLLFTNIIDSTFSDGSISEKNRICPEWKIIDARVGKCLDIPQKPLSEMTVSDDGEGENADINARGFLPLTFLGERGKTVGKGEVFWSDPITLDFKKDEYLCLELTFSGEELPCHEESQIPIFVKKNGEWKYCVHSPLPSMIGCDRPVEKRIAYFGDSITQGIGVKQNSYLHWNALLSERWGEENAYWNLGLGFGRAADAASDGIWMEKAKTNDICLVCFGVNDLCRYSAEEIKNNLRLTVEKLKEAKVKVLLQTVPPFDYSGEVAENWRNVNQYITRVLSEKVDTVFQLTEFLSDDNSPIAKFGGHPNEEGCAIWAENLYRFIKNK